MSRITGSADVAAEPFGMDPSAVFVSLRSCSARTSNVELLA